MKVNQGPHGFTHISLDDAAIFMAKAHKGQEDKCGVPYFFHPMRVAYRLVSWNCSDPVVFAGILHDVVEDTEFTLEHIKWNFGVEVSDLVDLVSRREDEKYKDYIERACSTYDSGMIKFADTLDNTDPNRKAKEVPIGRYRELLPKLYEEYQHLPNLNKDEVERHIWSISKRADR